MVKNKNNNKKNENNKNNSENNKIVNKSTKSLIDAVCFRVTFIQV